MKKRIFSLFPGEGGVSLIEQSLELLAEQKKAWPELDAAYENLKSLEKRHIRQEGYHVLLQHNPGRINSATASIDPASIGARPCFLCLQNLPTLQKGLVYRGSFLILCNPAPIFPAHFTIALLDHLPQSLSSHIPDLLRLARDFSPSFAVLYNGPASGASAPDHLHFQAVIRDDIPGLAESSLNAKEVKRSTRTGVTISTLHAGRPAIILEGGDQEEILVFLHRIIETMKGVLKSPEEPMMNLFCLYRGQEWRIIIYPRRRHRPEAYYKPDQERLMISPGAVEMGGFWVVPREEDFRRLDGAMIQDIYRDVALADARVEEIIAALDSPS